MAVGTPDKEQLSARIDYSNYEAEEKHRKFLNQSEGRA
jgi:hypothetical protein